MVDRRPPTTSPSLKNGGLKCTSRGMSNFEWPYLHNGSSDPLRVLLVKLSAWQVRVIARVLHQYHSRRLLWRNVECDWDVVTTFEPLRNGGGFDTRHGDVCIYAQTYSTAALYSRQVCQCSSGPADLHVLQACATLLLRCTYREKICDGSTVHTYTSVSCPV